MYNWQILFYAQNPVHVFRNFVTLAAVAVRNFVS